MESMAICFEGLRRAKDKLNGEENAIAENLGKTKISEIK
jgi:hypothetical protein